MGLFSSFGINAVHHYAPLHYLPFIARSGALKTRPTLRRDGFDDRHFRSMSSRSDEARGFGNCLFMTIDSSPRILKAKLKAGFPHIALQILPASVESVPFSLSRYNIAMTRRLRRNGDPGHSESDTNGRYYDRAQVPVARTPNDQRALLGHHVPKGTMVEIIVYADLLLPNETMVVCYSSDDALLARKILNQTGCSWGIKLEETFRYPRNDVYISSVVSFVERALAEPDWLGNGLEFDRVFPEGGVE